MGHGIESVVLGCFQKLAQFDVPVFGYDLGDVGVIDFDGCLEEGHWFWEVIVGY